MERKEAKKRIKFILLAGVIILAGIFMSFWLNNKNNAENQKILEEGRILRMAVLARFKERVSGGDEEVMDFCTEMYWLDIGDKNHPLFGSCPSSWENKGRITGMIITDDGELREIVYQSLDGSEERWTMYVENGDLKVEVNYSE